MVVKPLAIPRKDRHSEKIFIGGESVAPVAGIVFDEVDLAAAVQSTLDFCLTSDNCTEQFENRVLKTFRMGQAPMTNSESWILGQSK